MTHISARIAGAMLLAWGTSGLAAQPSPPKPPADPPGTVRMSEEQQRTIKLQTATAQRRAITEATNVAGTIVFDERHVARLRPLAPARVRRLLVQPGDRVHMGQALAEFDMPTLTDAQDNLAAVRAAVREADAGVAVARNALRRSEILVRDGSIAVAEAERRRLVLAQADAAAESARARTASLLATIARLGPSATAGVSELTTPIDGVVVSVSVTPGENVDPSAPTEAFLVADLSVVLVLAQVPEGSALRVRVDDPAKVTLASGGDRQWDGEVVALGAVLEPQARTVPARVRLANPDGALRAGMFVSVMFTDSVGRDDVTVPPSAIQMVGDKHIAFTRTGADRFESHDLRTGVERQEWVEVRQGLRAGDEVVTQGSFDLKATMQKNLLGGG